MGSMKKDAIKRIQNLTECCICLTTYTDPRILQCLHTFCLKCFEDIQSKNGKKPGDILSCPLCRKEFIIPPEGMKGLQKNFFIENFIEMTDAFDSENRSMPCSSCSLADDESDISEATHRCINCCENYCDGCAKAHRGQKLTREHKIVELNRSFNEEEMRDMFVIRMCTKHSEKVMDYYCSDCKMVVCVSCFVESHKVHECNDVRTVEKEFRIKIENSLKNLFDFTEQMLAKKLNLEKQKNDFLTKIISTENAIRHKNQELKALIDQQTQVLLDELSAMKKSYQKTFETDIEEIERHIAILESFVVYSTELKSKGSPSEVCRSVDNLITRAKELSDEYDKYVYAPKKSIEIELTAIEQNVLHQSNFIGTLSESVRNLETCAIVIGRRDIFAYNAEVIKINLNRPGEVSKLQNIPTLIQSKAAAAVHKNKIFVTGLGKICDEIWKFDAASRNWKQCSSNLQLDKEHIVTFVGHTLYICSGLDVAAFDTINDKSTIVGKLKYAVCGSDNCVPFRDSLYIFGGIDINDHQVGCVQVYDTKLDTCSLLSEPVPLADRTFRAVLLTDSVLLLGHKGSIIYNFDTGAWLLRDRFKSDDEYFNVIAEDGKIFIIGGKICSANANGQKGWMCRDYVRYIPIANILNDEPIEWREYGKITKPLVMLAFTKIDFFE